MTVAEKIQKLCEIEGYTDPMELVEDVMFGNRCGSPAICMTVGCDYSEDMEPDQDKGWCPECETNTLKSIEILTGVI